MANQKEKRGILLRFYKKVSGVLFILAALYCLPKSGLIAWRNKRDHHLAYLYHLLKDALDQNHVKKGFLALKDEFLFQFTLGNIIKFLIFCYIVMAVILLLPKVFELFGKLAKKFPLSLGTLRGAVQSVSQVHLLSNLECLLRYHVIPSAKSPYRMVGVKFSVNGKIFAGGFSVNTNAEHRHIPKLCAIAQDGTEMELTLRLPVSVIPTKSALYICGKFQDINGTFQRRKMLAEHPVAISVGGQELTVQALH